MKKKYDLEPKKILIVDDEPDVIDSLAELLEYHKIDSALSFESAKQLLESQQYDIVILDIMGVKGFDLLEIAKKKSTPAMMLTANALSPESLKQSADGGAVYFAPKDKMIDIEAFLTDIFQALDQKKSTWEKWFDRLSGFYDNRFRGPDWRKKEKEFWENKIKTRF